MLLDVEHLDAGYGDFQALFGVSVAVAEGETVAVIGANGAGKSTLLRAVAGLLRPRAGRIRFDGADLDGVPPHRRVRLGVSLVPEGRRVFPSLTVRENLEVGGDRHRRGHWDVGRVLELFPFLGRLRDRLGGTLSGGEQQALAIGRALMANPRLLLLDEVSLGLAPAAVARLYGAMPAIRAAGATVVVVEQDLGQALAAADRAYCLLEGRVVLSGAAASLTRDQLAEAYFGLRAAAGAPAGEALR
jgi:branched-chain amino acid transport system ATP-binding protein